MAALLFDRLRLLVGSEALRAATIKSVAKLEHFADASHSLAAIDQIKGKVMAERLNGLRVAILATDGFEQSELTDPRQALDAAGAKTTVVSLRGGTIKGWKKKDWGDETAVDAELSKVKTDQFDALLLPGGVNNPDTLRTHPEAVAFVKGFVDEGKPIAAICHGPWTLINAGGVKGRELTSWPSLEVDLQNAGATWVDREVVVSKGLVTSRKPDDLPAFNRETIKLFAQCGAHSKAA